VLLPLLYSLPEGIVAGVPEAVAPNEVREPGLAAWGPVLATEPDLRHAVRRPPRRAVVPLPDTLPAAWLVALDFLRRSGTTLVLHARHPGSLLLLADRVLTWTRAGFAWRPVAVLAASRRLRMHFGAGPNGEPEVCEIPLRDHSPEWVLSAWLARGRRPIRSEIVYRSSWR
jgi:hypothetical protein